MFFEWFSHWDWDRSHWRLGRIGPKTELIYVGLYPCNCFEGTGQKTIELLPMISKRTSFRPTFAHGYGGGVSWPHFCELSHQYFPAAPAASESLRSTEGRAVFRTPPPRPPPPFRWKKRHHGVVVAPWTRPPDAGALHLLCIWVGMLERKPLPLWSCHQSGARLPTQEGCQREGERRA